MGKEQTLGFRPWWCLVPSCETGDWRLFLGFLFYLGLNCVLSQVLEGSEYKDQIFA